MAEKLAAQAKAEASRESHCSLAYFSQTNGNSLPVGTILPYTGATENIPKKWALCDGSNGTPNLTGRFLQGWGWDDFQWRNSGEYIQEGLPNLWGELYSIWTGSNVSGFNGAFRLSGYPYDVFLLQKEAISTRDSEGYFPDQLKSIQFNAQSYNGIYGNSVTVQPRSYVVLYIMKVSK